jgi:hypothetical protein
VACNISLPLSAREYISDHFWEITYQSAARITVKGIYLTCSINWDENSTEALVTLEITTSGDSDKYIITLGISDKITKTGETFAQLDAIEGILESFIDTAGVGDSDEPDKITLAPDDIVKFLKFLDKDIPAAYYNA